MGRQPPEWDRDDETERACREWGLRFRGRPPVGECPADSLRELMGYQARSKYILAFSNRVDRHLHTHPTREYLTCRWFDALACGASLAGVTPRSPSADQTLWPGACLDLGTLRRQEGLPILADAVRNWRPERAATNHRFALERLDWRWRFATIAEALGEAPPRLEAELELVRQAIARGPEQVGTPEGEVLA